MKVSLKQDSLAYQFGVRPGVLCRDVGNQPVASVVASLNKFMNVGSAGGVDFKTMLGKSTVMDYTSKGHPEVDAIMFYMMNHAVSIIRQKVHPYESLGAYLPVVEEYHNMLAIRGARMFFYLLLICTRESRHIKNDYSESVWTKLVNTYGEPCKKFHSKIRATGSTTAADYLRKEPPETTLGNYTAFLSELFYKGKFSGGYGGPAWGKVADVLRDFVQGKLSAEMMLDTSFTLCHNNGPIFNKGMLFDSYTNLIYKILDVQRSGQIPQLIANEECMWHDHNEVKSTYELCRNALGSKFEGYVDWFLVEELGAMHTYNNEKQAQQQKHGYPTKFKAKLEAEKMKKEIEAQKQAEEAKKWVEVMPNLKVKKIDIKRGV